MKQVKNRVSTHPRLLYTPISCAFWRNNVHFSRFYTITSPYAIAHILIHASHIRMDSAHYRHTTTFAPYAPRPIPSYNSICAARTPHRALSISPPNTPHAELRASLTRLTPRHTAIPQHLRHTHPAPTAIPPDINSIKPIARAANVPSRRYLAQKADC